MPRESKQPSSSQSPKVGSSSHEGSQSRVPEGSPQLNSATTSLAHEGGQRLGFKRSNASRHGEESLGTHARILKEMSEVMADVSAKLQELHDEELSACMPPRKRSRLDQ